MFRGILCLVKDLFWQDKKQQPGGRKKKEVTGFFPPTRHRCLDKHKQIIL